MCFSVLSERRHGNRNFASYCICFLEVKVDKLNFINCRWVLQQRQQQFHLCVLVVFFPKWAIIFYDIFVAIVIYLEFCLKFTSNYDWNCQYHFIAVKYFFSSKIILNNITNWYCKIIVHVLFYVQSSERMVNF